mmetsp:Transcript_24069/g.46036  ORF Transcript_24069/g.46036 Transcript_24069/m.46036 type:complete len:463 (+) Transcript_24069:80-1468(+)
MRKILHAPRLFSPKRIAVIIMAIAIISIIKVTKTTSRESRPQSSIKEGRTGTATAAHKKEEQSPTERTIASTIDSIIHVTHTHTSSNDTWLAAFDSLERHGRNASALGKSMRYVVCIDKLHPGLEKWPWLEVVEYENNNINITVKQTPKPLLYPAKVANCLQEVMKRHNPKMVLHTMEDMIPMGTIRWELIAAAARILAASPEAHYFRFGCVGVPNAAECKRLQEAGFHKTNATNLRVNRTAKLPDDLDGMRECGNCQTGYNGVNYAGMLSILPMLVRPREYIEFHKEHDARGTSSGSGMETWSHKHAEERAGIGLQGFVDGSKGGGDYRFDSHRRYAYPYIHSGVQFGMWMSAHFPEVVCPSLEVLGIEEAGAMNCKVDDENATPPCMCDHSTQCETKDGLRRKFFKPPKNLPSPDGCTSWREQGRPQPKPVPPVGLAVETTLREEGLWEEPDLVKAWMSL